MIVMLLTQRHRITSLASTFTVQRVPGWLIPAKKNTFKAILQISSNWFYHLRPRLLSAKQTAWIWLYHSTINVCRWQPNLHNIAHLANKGEGVLDCSKNTQSLKSHALEGSFHFYKLFSWFFRDLCCASKNQLTQCLWIFTMQPSVQ